MAIKGDFTADFSDFQRAVSEATVTLDKFEANSRNVETSLTKMSNSLSGTKMISDATLMAQAVENIGGVSKLTEDELARLGAQAAAAADKMRAMGMEVPANLQQIVDKSHEAEGIFGGMTETVTSLATSFGLAFSVEKLAEWTKQAFETADALVRLSDRTAIGVETLQRLGVAGEEAGVSLEQIANGMNKLQKNLGVGSDSTVGALQQLGLQFKDLKDMTPEQQFYAVADAIKGIEDPTKQVELAVQLFGKSGAELLPVIKRGFDDVKNSASDMSKETVKALDDAGDAWGRAKTYMSGLWGEAMADIVTLTTSGFRRMKSEIEDFIDHGVIPGAAQMKNFWGAVTPPGLPADLAEIEAGFDKDAEAIKRNAEEQKKMAAAMEDLNSVGKGWQGTLDTIDGDVVESIKYYLEAGVAQDKLATAFGLTAAQVKAVESAVKDYAETLKKVQKIEEDTRTKQEAGILGLSKLDQEASQKKMEAAGKGATEIEKIYADLRDYQMKTTTDVTTSEVMKTWAAADEKIKAFKGTSEQAAQYADLVYQDAQNKQDAIYDAAYDHYKHLNDAILVDVVDVANKIKGVADDAVDHVRQATAQLETLAGGTKLPGSTVQTAFGQNYLVAPNGQRVQLGPHGELPDNYLSILSGASNFSSGISSQSRIGSGFNVPSYAQGGYGDFGSGTLALLHGLEAIVPLDKSPQVPGPASLPADLTGRPLGGGAAPIAVSIHVTQPLGTPDAIARAVGDALMNRLRGMGTRTP
jgi:hypothetical protein